MSRAPASSNILWFGHENPGIMFYQLAIVSSMLAQGVCMPLLDVHASVPVTPFRPWVP